MLTVYSKRNGANTSKGYDICTVCTFAPKYPSKDLTAVDTEARNEFNERIYETKKYRVRYEYVHIPGVYVYVYTIIYFEVYMYERANYWRGEGMGGAVHELFPGTVPRNDS